MVRSKKTLQNVVDQLDTRVRATLYAIQSKQIALAEKDVINIQNFVRASIKEIKEEMDDSIENLDVASRESRRMQHTLDMVLSDM